MGIVLGRKVGEGFMGGQNQKRTWTFEAKEITTFFGKRKKGNHHFGARGIFDNNNNNNAVDKDLRTK